MLLYFHVMGLSVALARQRYQSENDFLDQGFGIWRPQNQPLQNVKININMTII